MDAVAEWTAAQQRVTDLLSGLTPAQAATVVPACPEWSVHDLLAHMVGLDADVLAGNEPDDHNATWTAAQVAARADVDVAGVLAEWQTLSAPLRDWMRANTTRPLGDVIIHEQDLRGALARAGGRDSDGFAALRDRMAGQFAAAVADAGLPAIALVGPTWTVTAGHGDAAVVVSASDYDLARALMSRRSAAQLQEWADGDVTPYLPAFAGLGDLPTTPLVE